MRHLCFSPVWTVTSGETSVFGQAEDTTAKAAFPLAFAAAAFASVSSMPEREQLRGKATSRQSHAISIQHSNTRRRWQGKQVMDLLVPHQVQSPECLFNDAPEGSAKIAHQHVTVVTSFTYSMVKTKTACTWSHAATGTPVILFYIVSPT